MRGLEEMEVTVPPDPIDGIAEAIAALAGSYKLGVVSDAIYSPGRCLRQWLEMHDLIQHFDGFAFSDEVGHSKPHRDMFAHRPRHVLLVPARRNVARLVADHALP